LPGPPISMRWTGKAWQKVTVSVPVSSQLNAVAFAPGGTAWAAGATLLGHSMDTLIARWSGNSWTRVASPTPGPDTILNGLGFATSGYGWAVGETPTTSENSTTVILHWNGQMWSGPAGQVSPAAAPASSAAPSAVASPAPSPAVPPPTQVTIQGMTIGISAVNTDPDAMDVATTLGAYFGEIDARNYMQAWDTYTPALQAAVPFQEFSSAERTSQDTQIVVQGIQHGSNGDLVVQVGFQSHQAGQYGPDPGQTCTNWSLDYHLVASPGAQPSAATSPSYLITEVKKVGAGHTSC
jgi:hypothetical protein